jgi:dihydrofolate reductase
MRKIIWFNLISVDGYFEGPNQDIDWHRVDEEFNDMAMEQLDSLGTLLFGRVTYEMMAGYWPTEMALNDDPEVAGKMNSIEKVVFSKSLPSAAWSHTRLVHGDPSEEVRRLKAQSGKDMAIFGSGKLGNTLLEADLMDEIRIIINPVLLRRGRPMFEGGEDRMELKLLGTRTFVNGNVLLRYEPVKENSPQSSQREE